MKTCAILSMDCLDDFEVYDQLIEDPLLKLGWHVETISWRAANINWDHYQAVVIRTPWDYQDDANAFINVLEQIENSNAHLENSLGIVKWNIDKLYLQELEKLSVQTVPTIWCQRLTNKHLTLAIFEQYFSQMATEQLVLKPRISANADNTFWLNKDNIADKLPALNQAFVERDFMVQPFMEAIVEEGEYSLFYFNGQYSHAILKTPKFKDFRVQEEHGGQLTTINPEASLISSAEHCLKTIAQLHGMPLYARVDLVRTGKGFALMEVELIEPSLYFNMDDGSAQRFAVAFAKRMDNLEEYNA